MTAPEVPGGPAPEVPGGPAPEVPGGPAPEVPGGPASDAPDGPGADAAFAVRLGAGARPAVLVVDVLRAYLDAGSPLYADVESARAAAAEVVAAARRHGVPCVFTRVRYEPDGSDAPVWLRKIPALWLFADPDDPRGDWPDDPRPRDGELVVTKQHASAFSGTGLADRLQRDGIDTVLIVGFSTSGCVRATAVDAVAADLVPLVVREAVGDRTDEIHEASLFDLDTKYADVISADEALRVLSRPRRS